MSSTRCHWRGPTCAKRTAFRNQVCWWVHVDAAAVGSGNARGYGVAAQSWQRVQWHLAKRHAAATSASACCTDVSDLCAHLRRPAPCGAHAKARAPRLFRAHCRLVDRVEVHELCGLGARALRVLAALAAIAAVLWAAPSFYAQQRAFLHLLRVVVLPVHSCSAED